MKFFSYKNKTRRLFCFAIVFCIFVYQFYEVNEKILDPTRLDFVDPKTNFTIHTVHAGETLKSISLRHGLEFDAISKFNRLVGELTPRYVGKQIVIPTNQAYLRVYNSQYWRMGSLGLNVTSRISHPTQSCIIPNVAEEIINVDNELRANNDQSSEDDADRAWSGASPVAHKTLHHWAPFRDVPPCSADAPELIRWSDDGGVDCVLHNCPSECQLLLKIGNAPDQLPVFKRNSSDIATVQCTRDRPGIGPVRAEYVRAECRCDNGRELRHLQLLMRAVTLPELIETRPKRSWYSNTSKNNNNNNNDKQQQTSDSKSSSSSSVEHGEDNLDVILLIIDSISRQHFLRAAPLSAALMEEWHLAESDTSHELIQLLGYNVVGRGTYNNLGKLYAGLPTYDEGEDKREFLWSSAKKHGYITEYLADEGYAVFPDRPYYDTDHKALEAFQAAGGLNARQANKLQDETLTQDRGRLCFGPRDINAITFNYTASFFDNYRGMRRFVVHHTISCHEATMVLLNSFDEHFYNFLKYMKQSGHLDNTALIVVGDHGAILSPYYTTPIGALEYKLPLANVLLPKWFTRRHTDITKRLQINQHRLTTPYDLYETMRHLFAMPAKHKVMSVKDWKAAGGYYSRNEVRSRIFRDGVSNITPEKQWSFSLLSDEIDANRTCVDAQIPLKWCSCVEWHVVDVKSKEVYRIAIAALNDMNKRIHGRAKSLDVAEMPCKVIELDRVVHATRATNHPAYLWRVVFWTKAPNPQLFVGDVGVDSDERLDLQQIYRLTAYDPKTGPESCAKGSFDHEHCVCAPRSVPFDVYEKETLKFREWASGILKDKSNGKKQ